MKITVTSVPDMLHLKKKKLNAFPFTPQKNYTLKKGPYFKQHIIII